MKKEKKRSSENLTTPKKDYSINLKLEEMVLRELENFEISDLFIKKVEQQIIKAPEFYTWTHKRWKHKDKAPSK